MKIVEKCPTMEQFDRIVNRWKEQLIHGQTDTNELVYRLRDFVQAEVDINTIKSNRWIPCYERLPEQTGYYLVCDSAAEFDNIRGRQEVAKFVIGRHGGHWYGAIRRECITHWMPLPEPPKEDDNG